MTFRKKETKEPAPLPSTMEGVLERITYQNQQNGFTVARLTEQKTESTVTLIGYLTGIPVGSTLSLVGSWRHDPVHGRQFQVETFTIIKPNTINGIERYLGSGLIKGIGPRYAKNIVAKFGLRTIEVLDENPEKLHEVKGLGRKRVEKIITTWREQREIHQIMIFLQAHGISATFAAKIFKTYGLGALGQLKKNPYRLTEDVWGVGFKRADAIALSLGVPQFDPRRARAGMLYALQHGAEEGHCYLSREELLSRAASLLNIEKARLEQELPELAAEKKIIAEQDRIFLPVLYYAEKGVAQRIASMTADKAVMAEAEARDAVAGSSAELNMIFAEEQKDALGSALSNNISVITGGPGTGKSTILQVLVHILEARQITYSLAAPTGRAAKRLSEATGRDARTIHRLLEFDVAAFGFKRSEENPIEADFIIIDEASMLDIQLAYALVRAVSPGSGLLLVGDVDQLPSVGPGRVLQDVIESKKVQVSYLKKIFRQNKGSLISLNAARINSGENLELLRGYKGDKDFYCIFRETPEEIEKEIISLYSGRLSNKYAFNEKRDVQILSPMRKGLVGTTNLNSRLQVLMAGRKGAADGAKFLTGDKVMQLRNNYEKDVFNGDLGLVVGGEEEDRLQVDFEGRKIFYESSEMHELELAYAITVHKSQGSEFPCVIIPIHTTHYPLLQRNLLYTAVTRGKRLVVLVGSARAIAMAIRNNKQQQRWTQLAAWIAAL